METRTDIISLDNQVSNLYKVTLSGREFTAIGVTDDHIDAGLPTPGPVTPVEPAPTIPTFTIIPAADNVDEGETLTITVTSTNVSDGATYFWSVTNPPDFAVNTGLFIINDNSSSFTVTPLLDFTTEGPETFTVQLRSSSVTGPIFATSTPITINDTSITPPQPLPTYEVIASKDNVDEGESLLINVNTENVSDGTTLYWSAFSPDLLITIGSLVINNNSGSFTVTPREDFTTEGPEVFYAQIRLNNSFTGPVVASSQAITINDTSFDPEPPDPEPPELPAPPIPTPEIPSFIQQPKPPKNDTHCSRIVFDQNFDTRKDIYVSFQSPKIPRLITESGDFFLLTEDGDVLVVDSTSNVTLFLVDGNNIVDNNPYHGSPGFGCGLMSQFTSTVSNVNMSGHFISMCLDFAGGYGLSGEFYDSGIKGNSELVPNSITARISSTNAEYGFLSTIEIPNFNILTTDFRSFRFVFKEHMNKIRVDLKTDDAESFDTVFEAETYIDPITLPNNVKIGLAASGNTPFSIKDITYSGGL